MIAFVAVLLIIAEPFVIIWALNTLFQTGIAYGWLEWLAVFALGGIVRWSFLLPRD